ncbi:MAG TPA: hypothetical protein VJ746_20735 [Nitrospira sp.]|nr:hypothetical protein [Nitrospira sp.]
MVRKQFLDNRDIPAAQGDTPRFSDQDISIPDATLVMVTSEMSDHPIDHVFDGHHGPGSTKWIADETGDQSVILAFDTPQNLRHVTLEVEETNVERTQELTLSISHDGGKTYREVLRQEYHFSPPGTTFEREEWRVPAEGATHLWVWLRPDKGKTKDCRATMTSLTWR